MSAILSTVIGLLLIYLVFAIVVSGLQEWWAQFRGHRGKFLLIGLNRLVDDQSVLDRLLEHPFIGALYRTRSATGKPPSYVDPKKFALALADVIVRRAAAAASPTTTADTAYRQAAAALTGPALYHALTLLRDQHSPLASALLPIVEQVESNLEKSLDGISGWFTSGMDRVSGWYKAYSQRRLFAIGLFVAMLANVDTIALFSALNHSPEWREALGAKAKEAVASANLAGIPIDELKKRAPTDAERVAALRLLEDLMRLDKNAAVPIGYACLAVGKALPVEASMLPKETAGWTACKKEVRDLWRDLTWSERLLKFLGFILTALAGVLGAPFWFAAMSKLVNLRGSGPPPKKEVAA